MICYGLRSINRSSSKKARWFGLVCFRSGPSLGLLGFDGDGDADGCMVFYFGSWLNLRRYVYIIHLRYIVEY